MQAIEQAVIRADADVTATSSGGSSFTGQGTSLAAGGVIATNRVLGGASAIVERSVLTVSGDVLVKALLVAEIDATTRAALVSAGNAFGITMAFNTIGWVPTNVFFAAVDALLGDPLISRAFGGETPAQATALVQQTPVGAGSVTVSAAVESTIHAYVGNDATSAPAALFGAGGMSVNGVLSSNRVSSGASAQIDSDLPSDYTLDADLAALVAGTRVRDDQGRIYEYVGAGRGPPAGRTTIDLTTENFSNTTDWRLANLVATTGPVTVEARNAASIDSTTYLHAEVSPSNDAGAGIVNSWIGKVLDDYEFTSNSGSQPLLFGDRVRVADDWTGTSTVNAALNPAGSVFQYMGANTGTGTRDLATQDYSNYELWKQLTPTSLITGSLSYAIVGEIGTAMKKELVGSSDSKFGLIAYNDVRGDTIATIDHTVVEAAGDVTVLAENSATITASDSSVVSAWNGIGGVIVTNLVLSSADALVNASPITTSQAGNLLVSAAQTGQIDASRVHCHRGLGRQERAAGVQLDRLEVAEHLLQHHRHAAGRPAHLGRVQTASSRPGRTRW